jgi:small conductance mechanosensitive channel
MIEEIKVEFGRQVTNYYNGLIELALKLLVAFAVLFLLFLISQLLKPAIRKRLKRRLEDEILAEFFSGVIHFTFITLGVLVGIQIIGLGTLVVGIFSGAGVAAIVLGFAFKDIGENFIAGIIMAFNRPFKTGDMIQLDSQRGRVLPMSIRETHIKTSDGKDVFIPNANILKGSLINYTLDGALRYEATIGIDYGSDMPKCFAIIKDVLKSIDGVQNIPAPSAEITNYTTNGLDVQFTFCDRHICA